MAVVCHPPVFYLIYSLVHFISKPGTWLLVPIVLNIISWFVIRPWVHAGFDVPMDFENLNSDGIDAVQILIVLIICWLYVHSSRFIEQMLGIFPPVSRPLVPVAPLKETSDKVDVVPVRIVVPPLPRRRQG